MRTRIDDFPDSQRLRATLEAVCGAPTAIRRATEGGIANVWLIWTATGEWVVKVGSDCAVGEILQEASVLVRLRRWYGFVPELMASGREGPAMAYVLLRAIPGRTLFSAWSGLPNDALYRTAKDLGRTLRWVHSWRPVKSGGRPWAERVFARARSHIDGLYGTASAAIHRARRLVLLRELDVVEGLVSADTALGWIHGDVRLDNVVVGAQGVRGVIDWGRSAMGPVHYDVAAALNSVRVAGGDDLAQAVLIGYGAEGLDERLLQAYTRAWRVLR